MERAVFKHLYIYLKVLITKEQAGFLPSHSTVTQLLEIYDDIVQALDQKHEIQFTFFDISKAFDRVWHPGLIIKLQQLGITDDLLQWIISYLENRSQKVVLNGITSNELHTFAGVPQGSVLGPLLFLCFINDLPSGIINEMRLFADDTCLYAASTNLLTSVANINHDLEIIREWAFKWNVDFNAAKTVSMLISRRRQPSNIDIIFDNHVVIPSEFYRHLRIIFNSEGTWSNHIDVIVSNALKRLSILRGLKYILDRKSLEIMYKSFVRPSLEYADILWDGITLHEASKLDKIQTEALRIISGITRSAPTITLYAETGFQKLSIRRKIHRLIMLYKIINGLA
jgi:hypothetical protein